MALELKIRKASVYGPSGVRAMVYDFKCARCQNIVMFFEQERCPIVCKCGCVLANVKLMHEFIVERISWHYYYMTKGA